MPSYSRKTSFCWMFLFYATALLLGLLCFRTLTPAVPAIWAVLIADVAATVYVWLIGVFCKNVSVYDPYWSVLPPVVFLLWACRQGSFGVPVILLLVAVWYWGIRLTANWAYTFKGLGHEDWRYTRFRESETPFVFQLINFFGLNLFPTLIVFACMLPGFHLIDAAAAGAKVNALTVLGCILCLSSATIQLVADTQIHRFRQAHPGQCCDAGLWRKGRHPNYFGEMQMWWGIWLMDASLGGFQAHPWYLLAPIAMSAMFLCISIPMMERRQLRNKSGYSEYRARTRLLI